MSFDSVLLQGQLVLGCFRGDSHLALNRCCILVIRLGPVICPSQPLKTFPRGCLIQSQVTLCSGQCPQEWSLENSQLLAQLLQLHLGQVTWKQEEARKLIIMALNSDSKSTFFCMLILWETQCRQEDEQDNSHVLSNIDQLWALEFSRL